MITRVREHLPYFVQQSSDGEAKDLVGADAVQAKLTALKKSARQGGSDSHGVLGDVPGVLISVEPERTRFGDPDDKKVS